MSSLSNLVIRLHAILLIFYLISVQHDNYYKITIKTSAYKCASISNIRNLKQPNIDKGMLLLTDLRRFYLQRGFENQFPWK